MNKQSMHTYQAEAGYEGMAFRRMRFNAHNMDEARGKANKWFYKMTNCGESTLGYNWLQVKRIKYIPALNNI